MPDVYRSRRLSNKPKKNSIPKEVRTESIIKDLKKEVGEKRGLLSLFLIAPKDEGFEIQDKSEQIIIFVRPHWITTISWLTTTLVFVLLPSVIKQIIPAELYLSAGRFIEAGLILWYLFVLAYLVRNFLGWYYDVYFVTDERVVSIEFVNMMQKKVSDTKVDRIQDIALSQKGFFQSMFNYGDVLIQTAAEVSLFTFKNIPRPQSVVEALQRLILQEEAEFYNLKTREVDDD